MSTYKYIGHIIFSLTFYLLILWEYEYLVTLIILNKKSSFRLPPPLLLTQYLPWLFFFFLYSFVAPFPEVLPFLTRCLFDDDHHSIFVFSITHLGLHFFSFVHSFLHASSLCHFWLAVMAPLASVVDVHDYFFKIRWFWISKSLMMLLLSRRLSLSSSIWILKFGT